MEFRLYPGGPSFRLTAGGLTVLCISAGAARIYGDFMVGGPISDLVWAVLGKTAICPPTSPNDEEEAALRGWLVDWALSLLARLVR